jgi:hypothetical protein
MSGQYLEIDVRPEGGEKTLRKKIEGVWGRLHTQSVTTGRLRTPTTLLRRRRRKRMPACWLILVDTHRRRSPTIRSLSPRWRHAAGGRCWVESVDGQAYHIRLTNRSDKTIFCFVHVDGASAMRAPCGQVCSIVSFGIPTLPCAKGL